jgi:hypothetical protein
MQHRALAGRSAIAVFAILASSQALAQAVITIEPEQRTRIREYVVREHVRPAPIRERVVVGATVPAEVELAPVPTTWGVPAVRNYRYFYWDDRVVFVEPSSRRIVHIVD